MPGDPQGPREYLDRLLGSELFRFTQGSRQIWTVADAFEGTQVFGATGSGKTSGSGRTIAAALLGPRRGPSPGAPFGGLVLTAKPDHLRDWVGYFKAAGRSLSDITVICPREDAPTAASCRKGSIWPDEIRKQARFAHNINLLEYEFRGGGGLTHNLVTLFMNAMASGGSGAVSKSEPYWDEALRELLTHAIDLIHFAGREISLSLIDRVVRTAPQSVSDLRRRSTQRGEGREFHQLLEAAVRGYGDEAAPEYLDLVGTVAFWQNDFPRLNERTRSIITSSFTGKAAGLLRSPLRDLLCAETTDPEAEPTRTHEGRILILYLPIKLYGEVGRFAQVLYKTIWQRATERRIESLSGAGPGWRPWHPVFLWTDEAQYFVAPEDMLFQMTARSSGTATVYLAQNISSYYASMRGEHPKEATDSLLGNLQTKIFHANGDPKTNEWAESLFGTQVDLSAKSGENIGTPTTRSIIPAVEYTRLAKGGPPAFQVEGYFFQPGRDWGPDRGKKESYRHVFEQERSR